MAKIIQFPSIPKQPSLNWEEIESIRAERFQKIPKKVITIMRRILENGGDHLFDIADMKEGYPPDPIEIVSRRSDLIWVLDLLDRFGGEMSIGRLSCTVKRKKARYPFFQFQAISESMVEGFHGVCGSFYEHYLESNQWRILGKDLPETDLVALVIENKEKANTHFLGLLDQNTAFISFERLNEGMSITSFLELAGISPK